MKKNVERIYNLIEEHKTEQQNVELVAVTKYVDSDTIRKLYDLGLRHFGENRSNELLSKQEELADINADLHWHFIGRLQRRPVKDFINKTAYLHSLDRESLMKEVNKRAENPVKAFLQVNISGEEQKAGFTPSKLLEVIQKMEIYPMIEVVGLMTMAPHDANEDQLQTYFKNMKSLQKEIQSLNLAYAPCNELSMGMSNDFSIAVQEGATMIRVGNAIYKE